MIHYLKSLLNLVSIFFSKVRKRFRIILLVLEAKTIFNWSIANSIIHQTFKIKFCKWFPGNNINTKHTNTGESYKFKELKIWVLLAFIHNNSSAGDLTENVECLINRISIDLTVNFKYTVQNICLKNTLNHSQNKPKGSPGSPGFLRCVYYSEKLQERGTNGTLKPSADSLEYQWVLNIFFDGANYNRVGNINGI